MRKFDRNRRRTFCQILDTVATQTIGRLMERARTANLLAKSLRGKARFRAHAVKTETLLGLITKFPQQVITFQDARSLWLE